MSQIYALYSARNGLVRYVGKTDGCRLQRFERHKTTQIGRYVSKVTDWIENEWRSGFPVECALLESCDEQNCLSLETQWMNRFPNLLNEQKYGYRGGKPPIIPEIKDYMRGHIFNYDGLLGIHWCRDLDCFVVFDCWGDWLIGDAAPGWGGNIYFSDIAKALAARESHRKAKPYYKWMRDREVLSSPFAL